MIMSAKPLEPNCKAVTIGFTKLTQFNNIFVTVHERLKGKIFTKTGAKWVWGWTTTPHLDKRHMGIDERYLMRIDDPDIAKQLRREKECERPQQRKIKVEEKLYINPRIRIN